MLGPTATALARGQCIEPILTPFHDRQRHRRADKGRRTRRLLVLLGFGYVLHRDWTNQGSNDRSCKLVSDDRYITWNAHQTAYIQTAMGIFIDPVDLPKGGDGACQLIFLLLVYG